MARTEPFHTEEAPWRFSGIYHDNDRCIAGNVIPENFRVPGKGVCRECLECQVLNKQDEHKEQGPRSS
jgi:hypothetical protein